MVVLGIIVGSTRPGRVGAQVAQWVQERARLLPALEIRTLDLAEIGLPFLDEEQHPSERIYAHRHTREWSRQVAALTPVIVALGMIPVGAVQLPLRRRMDTAGVLRPVAADDEGVDNLLGDLVELTALLRPAQSIAS